jgi:hypothetical protein
VKQAQCLSADALADFIRGEAGEEEVRHVLGCEPCGHRASLLRRIDSAGVGPIADVIAEVDDLIAKLLAAPRGSWWKLVREPEYLRTDVARRLLALAVHARLRDRQLSVDLTKALTTIADKLGDGVQEIADLRFESWKFASAVLREAGRYTETETALVTAEDAAKVAADPELAQASVFLSRALFYAEPDVWRPEESGALLDRAERVFAQRDAGRLHAATIARAFLLYRAGNAEAAREKFQIVLTGTPKTDRESYLSAVSNWISVRVELREANREVEQTIALLITENIALGRTVQVARARWMLGRVRTILSEYGAAIDLLRLAMAGIGDDDSSIRIGLDAVEALLLDERSQEALDLTRDLASIAVALDLREPSRRHELTARAFAYVREAAQRETWTPDLIVDVAHYLDRITRQRPYDFVPPLPLATM